MSERIEFEIWLLYEQGLNAKWDDDRNCYVEFGAHIAWRAWQAARVDHERLVGALRNAIAVIDGKGGTDNVDKARTLLAQLDAGKGGE